MTYEDLQKNHDYLFVKEMDLYEVSGLKGLYTDGCIAIDKHLSEIEKSCILAEEIGHHLTSVGDILDQNNDGNKKQEYRARLVSYDIQIGLNGITECYEAGCTSIYSMAEHLDVTEEYLRDALEVYKQKYGTCTTYNNYIIYFEPCLGVLKRFE